MSGPIYLFISSSPDLAEEREALGQAVAELPIAVEVEVKHTPETSQAIDIAIDNIAEELAFITRCDLYVIVLGADFAAPMGVEWQRALNAGKPVLAYRKREMHSPSAEKLLRESAIAWTSFESPRELKKEITHAVAQMLLDRGEEFGLHVDDIDGLLTLLGKEDEEPTEKPDRRQGAGRGGIILGRDI